jgi:hypothetical protein
MRYDGGGDRGGRGFDARGFGRRGPYGDDFRPAPGWGGGHHDRERAPEDGWSVGFGPGSDAAPEMWGPRRYGLGPYHARLRARRRPDDEVRRDVEEALFFDTWVDAEAIQVEVDDGVVTLRGRLPDYEEVRYATDDAWDVDGVRGVRTELEVRTPEPQDDRRKR